MSTIAHVSTTIHGPRRMLALSFVLALGACAGRPPGTPDILENSLGMRFVRVPAGEFDMGGDETSARLHAAYPDAEPQRLTDLADEAPVHRVRIGRAFYLGQHEVTVGQFRAYLAASGRVPESQADGTGGYGYDPAHDPARSPRGDAFAGRDPRYSWRHVGFAQDDDHPVLNVTWNDAVAMARWLSEREHAIYRLPTEAEWEYACRAGTTNFFSFGDPATEADKYAWTMENSSGTSHPVGQKLPNPWGLYDMHGNVWEWCSDWFALYPETQLTDPVGPTNSQYKVFRGGGWNQAIELARSRNRFMMAPSNGIHFVGFRLSLGQRIQK